jgi:hypothetical protein
MSATKLAWSHKPFTFGGGDDGEAVAPGVRVGSGLGGRDVLLGYSAAVGVAIKIKDGD